MIRYFDRDSLRGEFVVDLAVTFCAIGDPGPDCGDVDNEFHVVFPFEIDPFDVGECRVLPVSEDTYISLGHPVIEYPIFAENGEEVLEENLNPAKGRVNGGAVHVLLGSPPPLFYQMLERRILRELASELKEAA